MSLDVFEFLQFGLIFRFKKKRRVFGYFWSTRRRFCICVFGDFFSFFKKIGVLWVFLVHPPMASVLLSALVEICFVSRMRDFFWIVDFLGFFLDFEKKIG